MSLPVPDLPQRILLDLRTDCNLKCPMCIVHGGTDDPRLKSFLRRSMPVAAARGILDEVMAARPLIQPNLWSEPLLAHDFRDHITAMKARGLPVAINTNGLLLKDELAQFFVDIELDSISVSIDATTSKTLKTVRGIDNLDKIHEAVARMLRVRAEAPLPRVGVSFTEQEENRQERDEFVAYWTPRVDFVRVGEVFENGGFPNMEVTGPRHPCPSLYSTLAIQTDGAASICCLDGFGETDMGNVFEQGVAGVWHGEAFTRMRHYHETGQWDKAPMCKDCERWASDSYEEEIRDGRLIRRSAEFTYYNRIDRLENWSDDLRAGHQGETQARDATTAAE